MEHFYVLSINAMQRTASMVPVYECIGSGLLDKWLLDHKDSLDDLVIGSWAESNGRVVMGGTAYAEDYLRYRI